ncbi:hypothetical protein CGZ69_30035 [Streptomyces peucetius subsp. caesius ATCC 27952]|nr:hypothetical protein CGZ69_30035 [Streptomyces peucetius subsp. caesius ATCC 27952]
MRIGCTGHQNLSPATRRQVAQAIAEQIALTADDELIGITNLAEGADQLFSFSLLAAGGQLHAVVPSKSYESSFQTLQLSQRVQGSSAPCR